MSDVRATTALTETLADIAKYYPGTADPARVQASQIQAPYGTKPPITIDVISLRRHTTDILTLWSWRTQVGRALTGRLNTASVGALTSFLARHAEWLTTRYGKSPQRTLDPIARGLEQVVKQNRPRRVEVGPCPELDDDGQPCTGLMIATVAASDTLLPSVIRCTTDPAHTWTPHEWHTLGRRVTPLDATGIRRFVIALEERRVTPRSWGTAPLRPVDLVKRARHAQERGA